MKKFKFLIFVTSIVLLAAFSREVSAAYYTSGTLTSTNLLSGLSVGSIDSFWYNALSIPAGTSLQVQFSNDGGSTWYNSAGTLNGWNTCTSTGGADISLSGLGWSTAEFRYKMEFTGGTDTPVLEAVRVDYSPPAPAYTPEKTMCDDSTGSGGGVVSASDIIKPDATAARSQRLWVVTGYDGVGFPTYSELQTTYGYNDPTTSPIATDPLTTDLSEITASGVYKIERDFTLASTPCTLPGSPAAVVFIDGDFTISTSFRATAINLGEDPLVYRNECNSSLVFIVEKDISITSGVNNIYGIFYAGGDMGMSTEVSSNPLYIFGSLLAHDFNLNRNLGADNADYPAEQVIFMPKYFITLKDVLGRPQISWKEGN